MDVLTAILAAGVAGGYFAIAALIVPRIVLEEATPRFTTAFRVGGIAFFVGCGLTHSHIAYHALVDDSGADLHEVIFHLLQVFGVWVFVYAAVRFLDVRVVRRKTPEELRAEALQKRVAELSRSNEDLEQFAHVIAHDLQEPLRSVSGFADLVVHRSAERLDDTDKLALDQIGDGARRMSTMLDGVLAYSRVAGTGLTLQRVALDELVAEVRASLAATIEERGAHIAADSLPVVHGDRVQLGQLLQNLVANAIKFSGDGPPRITVRCTEEGDRWAISVCDEGVGIDPRDAERIFQIFQRANGDGEPGSGIGLALAQKIVARHGGEIRAEPRDGGGTAVRFTLPRYAAPAEAPDPVAAAGAGHA